MNILSCDECLFVSLIIYNSDVKTFSLSLYTTSGLVLITTIVYFVDYYFGEELSLKNTTATTVGFFYFTGPHLWSHCWRDWTPKFLQARVSGPGLMWGLGPREAGP